MTDPTPTPPTREPSQDVREKRPLRELVDRLAEERDRLQAASDAVTKALDDCDGMNRLDAIYRLKAERDELQATFDLRWKADMRAIERWHATGNPKNVWPDHADMVVWLLEQLEQAHRPTRAQVEALTKDYDVDYTPGEVAVRYDAYNDAVDAVLRLYDAPQAGQTPDPQNWQPKTCATCRYARLLDSAPTNGSRHLCAHPAMEDASHAAGSMLPTRWSGVDMTCPLHEAKP